MDILREMMMRAINAVTNNIDMANSLDNKIDLINQNVQFNINLMWTMLSVVVATAGVALYALARMWVNKRVDEALPKAIQDNPPVLYFKGILNGIQSIQDRHGNCFSEGIIYIDTKKYGIEYLEFPVELDFFYYEMREFTIMSKNFEQAIENLGVKVPLEWYNATITEQGIKVWYKDRFGTSEVNSHITWTLKVPNPKYKNNINETLQ